MFEAIQLFFCFTNVLHTYYRPHFSKLCIAIEEEKIAIKNNKRRQRHFLLLFYFTLQELYSEILCILLVGVFYFEEIFGCCRTQEILKVTLNKINFAIRLKSNCEIILSFIFCFYTLQEALTSVNILRSRHRCVKLGRYL